MEDDIISLINTLHIPRWDELPELALYLDQVLEYVNTQLEPLFIMSRDKNNVITAAMINNYVKQKVMPAPEKKKYRKKHLAHILSISILKQVINIADISVGMKILRSVLGDEETYDVFAAHVEKALRQTVKIMNPGLKIYEETPDVIKELLPIQFATIAFAAKIFAEYQLRLTIQEKESTHHE